MNWAKEECYLHDKEPFKQKMNSYKEARIKECQVNINSLIELHSLKFIDDKSFYHDIKSYMDKLETLNSEQVVINEATLNQDVEMEENKEPSELDQVIKNLQCQLLDTKSNNILSIQKLMKETESHVIDEQTQVLNKHMDYINNCIVPLKEIYAKLYEECAALE